MDTDFTDTHHFEVPVTFCEGRQDYHVSSAVARDWYETIDSPKSWHWFDRSGHFPQWEEPDRFLGCVLQDLSQ